MLRATPEAPSGIVITVSAPSVMACVTYPLIACSIRVPKFRLVVVPHVPACSPVVMSSNPKFVEYVEAIFLPSFNPYLFSPIFMPVISPINPPTMV